MSRKPLASRIYLTGFMGSGKSTTGPMLAERLGYDFVDLDQRVEEVAQKPITTIFEEDGEMAFLAFETDALRNTISRNRLVVATGGGALLCQKQMEKAKEAGVVVYIRLTAETLVERLYGIGSRPRLQQGDEGVLSRNDLFERIRGLLTERAPFYNQADFVIDADGLSPQVTAQRIAQALNEGV